MKLEDSFIKLYGIIDYKVEKQFVSKKNKVWLIDYFTKDSEKKCIVKCFNGYNLCNKEYIYLNNLKIKGIKVPDVYYVGIDYIVEEFLDGILLLDYINNMENTGDYRFIDLFDMLFMWFNEFYNYTEKIMSKRIILKDINFRNFIIKDDSIYGFDFEDCTIGKIEEDIGKIAAFSLTYYPIFTNWKIEFVKSFIEYFYNKLHLSKTDVMVEMNKELEKIGKRRNIKIRGTKYDNFLVNY